MRASASTGPSHARGDAEHCITCSDEGVPMMIVRLDGACGLALCEAADGSSSSVEIALVPEAVPGDRVLAHAGVALALLRRGEGAEGAEGAEGGEGERGAGGAEDAGGADAPAQRERAPAGTVLRG